jgi:hypothetical protein
MAGLGAARQSANGRTDRAAPRLSTRGDRARSPPFRAVMAGIRIGHSTRTTSALRGRPGVPPVDSAHHRAGPDQLPEEEHDRSGARRTRPTWRGPGIVATTMPNPVPEPTPRAMPDTAKPRRRTLPRALSDQTANAASYPPTHQTRVRQITTSTLPMRPMAQPPSCRRPRRRTTQAGLSVAAEPLPCPLTSPEARSADTHHGADAGPWRSHLSKADGPATDDQATKDPETDNPLPPNHSRAHRGSRGALADRTMPTRSTA